MYDMMTSSEANDDAAKMSKNDYMTLFTAAAFVAPPGELTTRIP
jgi:hypothetical protein